jgi:hypothetical protein
MYITTKFLGKPMKKITISHHMKQVSFKEKV